MKIIYFHTFRGNAGSGVNKKVLAQVRSLNEAGVPSTMYAVVEGDEYVPADPCITTVRYTEPRRSKINLINIIRRERRVNTILSDLIATLSDDDIIYMRIPYPSPFSWVSLHRPRRCKVVIEYQTIEPTEYLKKRMFVYLIVDLLFGNGLRKYSDAIVGVTEEITRYQLNRSGDPKKPNITIGNGFNVHSVPERFPPPFSGKELHLICVADFSIWHGIDRLLHGMKLYRGPVKIFTHIVGTGKDTPRLERLVTDLDLTHNVFFHGFQTGKDLDDLFHISHVAVGSLGIHRIGLSQISVLKIREYCSRGIPFIIACDDPDFPDVFPYALKLPPNDDAIDMTTVIQFATGIFHDTDYPQKMRDYALTHLDWSIKMQNLKDFFESLNR